jgi:hypothetical protein
LELVKRVARTHRGSTVWIINRHEGQWTKDLAAIDALTEGGIKYGGTVLRFLGEPTQNLIEDGGFESEHAGEGFPEAARITSGGYQGSASAMLETTQPGFHAVSLPVAVPAGELATGRLFTLSMALKYDTDILDSPRALERQDDASIGVRVVLSGFDSDGVPFETDVIRLRGRREWRHYSFCVKPGEHLPRDASLLTVQVGVYGGTGSVWIDDVQFEAKDHPTPFVDGVRPPHDEYLLQLDRS